MRLVQGSSGKPDWFREVLENQIGSGKFWKTRAMINGTLTQQWLSAGFVVTMAVFQGFLRGISDLAGFPAAVGTLAGLHHAQHGTHHHRQGITAGAPGLQLGGDHPIGGGLTGVAVAGGNRERGRGDSSVGRE